MPFGLMSSGCTVQHVHEVLLDLSFIFVYIDVILVSSRSVEENQHHLREVFSHLRANNLTVNMDKCVIAQPMVTFLSHRVDSEGIHPLPEKVAAIQSFPPPATKLACRGCWGCVIFTAVSYPTSPTSYVL